MKVGRPVEGTGHARYHKNEFGVRAYVLERQILAMVANRALAPSSKLAMEDWVAHDVEIPGPDEVHSHQLYRAMDELLEAKDSIEKTSVPCCSRPHESGGGSSVFRHHQQLL